MASSLSKSFEALPPEIKILIMREMPDPDSLRNIVRASPDYHQTYLGAREEILHQITFRSLQKHNISVRDAQAAFSVPQFIPSAPYRKQDVLDFFDSYGRNVLPDQRRLAVDESRVILHLQRTFSALVDRYCETMLTRNPYSGSPQELEKPSPSELHRLHRALWRWELYSRLSKSETDKSNNDHFDIVGRMRWQAPSWASSPITKWKSSPASICTHASATESIDNLISRGPLLLHRVLTASSPQDKADLCMNNADNINVPMTYVMDAYERVVDSHGWPWKGKDDPSNAERLPTLGWKWASCWSTSEVDSGLRKWGYVFWDDGRLVNWGLTLEIIEQYPWGDDDDNWYSSTFPRGPKRF
ncbi:hypothetical protein MMC28_008968 [Mycoblastus sanguinarius]|nr:hypothetical protein [Mycoblastus sanguinarius]